MPAMTGKANLLLVLVLGLLVAGLITRSGEVALLALPLAAYLAAGLLKAPGQLTLNVERELEGRRGEAGRPASVRLTVENAGQDLACLRVWDELPEGAECGEPTEGWFSQPVEIAAGEKLELDYTLRSGRGRYDWRFANAAASDPLGLFEQRVKLAAPGTIYLLPPPLALKGVRIRPWNTRPVAGPHLSRRPGAGVDFYGVREYAPGDSMRRIHWRLSARHPGEFFSKEFEREEMADIGLLLDARVLTNIQSDGKMLLDYSIQAASALARGFLNAGDRVSLLVLGKQVTRVFPGTGKRQALAIQEALAGCQAGENVSFQTLSYLPVRLFPSRSLMVIVSPLLWADLTPLSRLRAEGYQVLVVSPDPVDFSARKDDPDPTRRLGERAAALEREAVMWRARQLGIEVIPWKVDQPFVTTMRSAGRGRR